MRLIIGNDIHLGSKHATHTWTDFRSFVAHAHGLILNGDIFDFANCKRSEFEMWRQRALETKAVVEANHGHFIRGNHCLNQIDAPDWVMLDGVMFHHGDMLFWSKEKYTAYRSKKPGAGFLKRWFTPAYDNLRHFADGGPNKLFLENLDKLIVEYPNMRAIVVGHRHPVSNIIFEHKGIKCYILKRGIQTIEI